MTLALAAIWPQPLCPVHSLAISALVAVIPLAIVLVLMGEDANLLSVGAVEDFSMIRSRTRRRLPSRRASRPRARA